MPEPPAFDPNEDAAWTDGDESLRRLALLEPDLGPECYLLYVNATRPDLGVPSMLSVAEGKIGPKELVRSFNLLPAETCWTPIEGRAIASPVCRAVCFFHKMCEGRPGVAERAKKNIQVARRPDFAELIVGAIRRAAITFCKIHVVGDFFSVAYINAWSRVAELLPDVTFWTYTRSWRVPSLVPALERLAIHDNMSLFFSYDHATGTPPPVRGARLAWMASHDEDLPPAPTHIVFRASVERRKTPLTRLGLAFVCPHQTTSLRRLPACIDCAHCLPPTRPRHSCHSIDTTVDLQNS
jgi:hypothetical protein